MPQDQTRFIDDLLARMSLREKIGQLNYPHADGLPTTGAAPGADTKTLILRGELCGTSAGHDAAARRALQTLAIEHGPHGIPLFFAKDCIQRYVTGAPIPLAQSCSWEPELLRRIAAMTAAEARADGVNLNWAPMLDITHDARWGRVAEGHGELPYLCARLAEAVVRGYQGEDGDLGRPGRMMATLKHFAGYGLALAGRDYAAVEASPATLMRIMEPFRAAIDAGAGAVMVAFSTLNDMPATAHRVLLTDVLRQRFGFKGMVVTDFTAINPELVNHGIAANAREAAYLAFTAGVTVDLVSCAFLNHLEALVAEGRITADEVTARCRLVLEAKARLGLFDDPYLGLSEGSRAMRRPRHVTLAREAAVKGLVLLKNDGVLPLARGGSLAVIGPLANNRIDMQGTWAIDVDPAHCVTVLEGLRAGGGNTHVLHAKGCDIVSDPDLAARLNVHNRHMPSVTIDPRPLHETIAEALAVADEAHTIVLCVGEAKEHAGESSTRLDIGLPGAQQELFDALRATGKPLVVVAISGRPLALTGVATADALIWTGHPGSEGGHAIAAVLFGEQSPSGRLSMALPRHVGQLPLATEELPTGRPKDAIGIDVPGDDEVDATGQRVFRKFTTACILEAPHTPLFPAGFGLAYTRFAYGPVTASTRALRGEDAVLEVSVAVTNEGEREGTEVVQLWLRDPVARASRPVRELRGFARLTLGPGETRTQHFRLTTDELRYDRGPSLEAMVRDWEPGEFIIMVGANARDVQSLTVTWEK